MTTIDVFETSEGRCLYKIPVRSFPRLITNVFILEDEDGLALIDTGSGVHHSNQDLLDGLDNLNSQYNKNFSLAKLGTIFITHGHIDHFGALPFIREHNKSAAIGVHPLDRAVIDNHRERVTTAVMRLKPFIAQTGLPEAQREKLMHVYLFEKGVYQSQEVQFTLEEGKSMPHNVQVHHVPGHCAGLVCLQIDDVLITADHVLSKTTPHQAPEWIVPNMGLRHYFQSLDKIARLDDVRLGLGCHEEPMHDLKGRISEIEQMHMQRLDQVLDICQTPKTIHEVSQGLFGNVEGYHVLLALEEAGAHIEYLHQQGDLLADNLDELEGSYDGVIRYVRR